MAQVEDGEEVYDDLAPVAGQVNDFKLLRARFEAAQKPIMMSKPAPKPKPGTAATSKPPLPGKSINYKNQKNTSTEQKRKIQTNKKTPSLMTTSDISAAKKKLQPVGEPLQSPQSPVTSEDQKEQGHKLMIPLRPIQTDASISNGACNMQKKTPNSMPVVLKQTVEYNGQVLPRTVELSNGKTLTIKPFIAAETPPPGKPERPTFVILRVSHKSLLRVSLLLNEPEKEEADESDDEIYDEILCVPLPSLPKPPPNRFSMIPDMSAEEEARLEGALVTEDSGEEYDDIAPVEPPQQNLKQTDVDDTEEFYDDVDQPPSVLRHDSYIDEEYYEDCENLHM